MYQFAFKVKWLYDGVEETLNWGIVIAQNYEDAMYQIERSFDDLAEVTLTDIDQGSLVFLSEEKYNEYVTKYSLED